MEENIIKEQISQVILKLLKQIEDFGKTKPFSPKEIQKEVADATPELVLEVFHEMCDAKILSGRIHYMHNESQIIIHRLDDPYFSC